LDPLASKVVSTTLTTSSNLLAGHLLSSNLAIKEKELWWFGSLNKQVSGCWAECVDDFDGIAANVKAIFLRIRGVEFRASMN
jgi:hypothetical protein